MTERTIARELGAMMVSDIRKEEKLRGNYATGKLNRSLRSLTKKTINGYEANVGGIKYFHFVEQGVSASRVKVTKAYLENVALWARKKLGLKPKAARKAAYFIGKKHMETGIPVDKSKLHAGEDAIRKNRPRYDAFVEKSFEHEVKSAFSKIKNVSL